MTIDRKKSILEDFKQTLTDELDRNLVEAYAEDFDYNALEQAFSQQLIEEVRGGDET